MVVQEVINHRGKTSRSEDCTRATTTLRALKIDARMATTTAGLGSISSIKGK